MSKFIPFILISGFVSFIGTPIMMKVAPDLGFVANPSQKRIHKQPTPMLGGLAIYIGLLVALIISESRLSREILGIMAGMTIVMLVGLWDDRYSSPPLLRVIFEIFAALMLVLVDIRVYLFRIEFLNIAITVLWVIGICNAFNLQDNMDGLAAGLATIASGSFFLLAMVEGLGVVATLSAAMLGASVGFLYYNFNPASLFMGDSGSLLIGFVLAVLGIKLEFPGRPIGVTWLIPIVILGVPIFDTCLVIISRIRRKRPVYVGGTDHTSHRLVSLMKMSHARAVLTIYLISATLGLLALMLRDATPLQARFILVLLSAIFISAIIWLEWKFSASFQDNVLPTH